MGAGVWRSVCGGVIALAAVVLIAAAGPAMAHFDPAQTSDYAMKERQLCYSITPEMKADPKWVGWVAQAAANWNAVSAQTGWSFRECAEGEKADISIGFGLSSDPTDSGGGGFYGDAGERQHEGQSLKQPHYDLKIVQDVAGKTINDIKIGGGGDHGWDTAGASSLDPVMVLMHELTHAMRLSHGPHDGWNSGKPGAPFDFERAVSPGIHSAAISADDITQTHAAAVEERPPVNLGYKLPACFADEAARAKAESDLKAIIWQLQGTIKSSAEGLVGAQGPSEIAGLYAQGRQAQSNLEAAQAMAASVPGLPICPAHAAAWHGQAPPNPSGVSLERGVFDQINYARTDPADYAQTLSGPGSAEAIGFLQHQSPLPPLTLRQALADSAARFAADAGPHGLVGHIGSDGSTMATRIHGAGVIAGVLAEEVSLGQHSARAVVFQLIIDPTSPTRDHRMDLFDPSLQFIGVGCSPHSVYGEICVVDMAGAVMGQ
jgi:hypothetical protein